MVGGASNLDADDLYNFGLNLGLAFQLQDDYLDTYGDEKVFGKKTGTDIVDNKKTFLMINALEKADGKTREELEYWLNRKEFDRHEKVDAVKAVYDKLNIGGITKEKINHYYHKAITYLEHLGVSQDKKGELYYVAEFLLNRNR